MKRRIRVLIVDDHAMMRLGLAEAISGERDLLLVGEASHCAQAVECYDRLKPDVVTMDLNLPGADGVETIHRLRERNREARIVVYSVSETEEDAWRVHRSGAMGYVSKAADIEEVLEAIREAFAGRSYFPAGLMEKLALRTHRSALTPRELEVLQQIVRGRRNKEIVGALHMSEATVKLHVSNILAKLEVQDRTQAAVKAVQRGIVRLV